MAVLLEGISSPAARPLGLRPTPGKPEVGALHLYEDKSCLTT